ncbi:SLC9A8 [Symbiodinium sp. CCMP2456]|nr:SLC9A8 [Symbiodinium sp. CCMP2456]
MTISDLKLTPAEAISTILVGIGLGAVAAAFPEVNRSTFQKLEDMSARQFMLVFIAPIIFAEGYGMKSQQFFDNITRILLHAFLGTLISALVVAVAIFYLVPLTGALKLELSECLAFGAMISSTDPVTTLAIFKEQSLAEKGRGPLYYSVLGESILNDAVAIALFGSFADLVRSGEVIDAAVSARIFLNFLKVFVASTLIGVAGGLATAFLLKSARLGAGSSEGEHFYFNIPEIGVALVLAYVPFLAAEACDLSGIVAIMFAGITMRHYAHFNLTQVTRQIFLPTVELIASLCETYVFILLGLGVFLLQGAFSASLVIWSALACLLGRLVHVYPLSFLANRISTGPKLSVKEMHMVWMAGLRGVIAFICALGFPNEASHQEFFLFTTVIVVGASLVFLGWPTAPTLRCLGLAEPEPEPLRAPRASWSTLPGGASARCVSQRQGRGV